MTKILAIINIKGGVGKTTSTVNLAAALSERDRKVLAVDLDPQASLTYALGLNPESIKNTIADVIDGRIETITSIIVPTIDKFDIAPSSHLLLQSTMEHTNDPERIKFAKAALEPVREKYDYIFLDCPANAGFLTHVALTAADQVLIPFTPDFLSFKSLEWLVSIIRKIQVESNPNLRISGIFYSMHDLRTRHAREVLKLVQKTFGPEVPVLSAAVGQSVRLKDATMAGKTIFQYAPDSSAAESYRTLARELEEGIQQPTTSELPRVLAQGHEALRNNDLAEAYVAFCRATEINPRLPDAWVGRAQSAPKWNESIEGYVRALELEPREQPLRENLALLVTSKIDSAGKNDVPELIIGAKHLILVDQTGLAESILKRATDLNPKNDEAWLQRALVSKDIKDSNAFLKRCLEINPRNEQAQTLAATAKEKLDAETNQAIEQAATLLKNGQRAEAHAKYLEATQLDPNNDVAWLGVARTAERLRDRLEYAEKTLKVNPHNTEAREFYGLLQSFLTTPDETMEPPQGNWVRWRWIIPVIIIIAIAIAVVVLTRTGS